jgi:FkbM family methyltransferase
METVKHAVLKSLLEKGVHDRVRGGYRLCKFMTRSMGSVPVRIDAYAPLYVDLRGLDCHAVKLFLEEPLPSVPHEPALTRLFTQIIRPTDVVFDVGANLGLHTLTFSRMAKHVVAFEPNPGLVPNLQKTISNIPNAELRDFCLSDRNGSVDFHISKWDHMLGSIANWSGQPTDTVSVPTHTLDSLLAEGVIPRPNVLKVDVEGAELLVFRGGERLLSGPEAPRAIIFEELNQASRRLGIGDGEAAEFLRARGYSLYLTVEDGVVPLQEKRPEAANLLASKEPISAGNR